MNNDNDDKRMLFENCRLQAKRVVNPIVDWSDKDVWSFLTNDCHPPVNPLYCEGWKRVGCVGCPMASKSRELEFVRWPRYKQLYINAFNRMLQERKARGKLDGSWRMGTSGTDAFNWWMEYDVLPGQIDLFEEDEYE